MSVQDAYVKKMRAKLYEWNVKIDQLQLRVEQTKEEAKQENQKIIGELKEKSNEAEKHLKQLEKSSEDAWDDIKIGVEHAWKHLGAAVKSASSKLQS